MTDSIKNAQINHGIDDFKLTEKDLEIEERDYKALTSTVLGDTVLRSDADIVDAYVCVKIPQDAAEPIVIQVSQFEIGIQDVKLADTADGWTNFGMLGVVTDIAVTPFESFLGYPFALGGRYRDGEFEMLAGNAFGSHVSVFRYGTGLLEARLPYSAY